MLPAVGVSTFTAEVSMDVTDPRLNTNTIPFSYTSEDSFAIANRHRGKELQASFLEFGDKCVSGSFGTSFELFEHAKKVVQASELIYLESNVDLYIQILGLVNLPSLLAGNSHSFSAVSLASSGFVICNSSSSVSCPTCKLEIELPLQYTNLLAAHLVLSPLCRLASALYDEQTTISSLSGSRNSAGSEAGKDDISEYVVRARSEEPGNRRNNSSYTDEEHKKVQLLHLREKLETCNIECLQFPNNKIWMENPYFSERFRKQSFTENGIPDSPRLQLLASRGLYLSTNKKKREIRCFHCNLRRDFKPEMLLEVEAASSLDKNHLNNNCGHIIGSPLTGNIPDVCNLLVYKYDRQTDASNLLTQTYTLNEFEGLGINLTKSKHPEMAVISRRLASFLTYPYKSAKHPEQLAEGGYFYSGNGESVMCYSCGIVSSDWTRRCDVFIRHARSYPTCAHVISTRGQQFVDDILAEFGSYHSIPPEDKITVVSNRMLRPRMDSIPLQKALDMGMSSQTLKAVVQRRIRIGAPDFKYIAEIAKEVQELNVPDFQLQEANAAYTALPKEINLPESESDKEEEVMSSADDQIDDTVEQSSSHVENRTNLSIETNKIEVVADVRTEATELKSELLCKVCMTEPVSMIFLPCSHLTCCSVCSAAMMNCPLCRKDVVGTIKIKFCSG